MNYEEPNMWIFMIETDNIVCTSGETGDLDGIEVRPIAPGQGEDSGGYH